MPKLLEWAIPGVVIWIVAVIAAEHWLTGERDEQLKKYGFGPLVLLLWYVPDVLLNISGAAEVEGFLLVVGFPIAAVYLGILLCTEMAERRKTRRAES